MRRVRELARALVVRPRPRVLAHLARLRLDLDHARDGAVEERAVVGDEDDARVEAVEEAFEPFEPREVEVVRRLVEQEHVEAREQDRRERGARRLAAGEGGQRAVEQPVEADVRGRGARPGGEVVSADPEEPLQRLAVVMGERRLRREPTRKGVHLGLGPCDIRPPREVRRDRFARPRLRLLWQVADSARARDRPGVRLLEPREHAQERRLPDPVRADDADAVAGADAERDVVEHGDGAERLGDVVCRERARQGDAHRARTSFGRKDEKLRCRPRSPS